MQAETTIYFGVWWVLFEYSSFDHFPYILQDIPTTPCAIIARQAVQCGRIEINRAHARGEEARASLAPRV